MRIRHKESTSVADAVMGLVNDLEEVRRCGAWRKSRHLRELREVAHAAFTEGWLMGRDSLGETSQGVIDEAFTASMVAEYFDEREESDD